MNLKPSYLLFVWLTTAIVGSLVYFLVGFFYQPNVVLFAQGILQMLMLCIGVTLAFSIPAIILFGAGAYYLSKMTWSVTKVKTVLAVFAVGLCISSFIVFIDFPYSVSLFEPSYCITLVASVYYFKLRG